MSKVGAAHPERVVGVDRVGGGGDVPDDLGGSDSQGISLLLHQPHLQELAPTAADAACTVVRGSISIAAAEYVPILRSSVSASTFATASLPIVRTTTAAAAAAAAAAAGVGVGVGVGRGEAAAPTTGRQQARHIQMSAIEGLDRGYVRVLHSQHRRRPHP